MRPYSKSILRAFWTVRPPSEAGLQQWWSRASAARWTSFAEVRRDSPAADLVKGLNGDELSFSIAGNRYRLVVLIEFGNDSRYILWVGTRAEYDRLDVKALQEPSPFPSSIP